MYRPLGGGDVDIAGVTAILQRHGFDGWYVLEQDTILAEARRTRDRCAMCERASSICGRFCDTSYPAADSILGASRIAENAMIKPATATGHRLVAVAARDPERARAYAAQHGIERVVGSYAELISDPEVDVVYNALPNSLHGPWNLAAVQAGKHVLTEKPFSSNAVEARAVAEAARVSGVTLLEGFHYLFHR